MIDYDVMYDAMAEAVTLCAEFDDIEKAERLGENWAVYPKVNCVVTTYNGDDITVGLNNDTLQQASHVTVVVPGYADHPVSDDEFFEAIAEERGYNE